MLSSQLYIKKGWWSFVLFLTLPCMLAQFVSAQDLQLADAQVIVDEDEQYISPVIFDGQEIINLEVKADLTLIFSDRDDDLEEYPGSVTLRPASGEEVVQPVQIKVRGNFRKQEAHCGFPPLRLNFKKKQVEGTLFDGLDKVKLVTHCQDWRKAHNQLVLLEYLAYKMYNEITPLSFNVRLANMTYIDESGKRKPVNRFGFIIEDDDDMARRNGGEILKKAVFHQDSTEFDQITRLSLFQYLIGNTDWSVPALHNIRLVDREDDDELWPVPYDFDFAGFVNAPYAVPPQNLPITDVRIRLFRGYCRSEEELQPHLDHFIANEDVIRSLIDDLEPMQDKYRKRARSYVNKFYKIIKSERRTKKQILKSCRRD